MGSTTGPSNFMRGVTRVCVDMSHDPGGCNGRRAGFPGFRGRAARTTVRYGVLLTCDHHAAQDLVQSALVRLARHWSRVSRAGTPDAYVRKIIYHEFVSSRRLSRSRELPIGDPIERAAPGDETNDAIRRLVLRQALARLTAGQRAVIVLRYFDDLTEAETAEALGCSIGTVK